MKSVAAKPYAIQKTVPGSKRVRTLHLLELPLELGELLLKYLDSKSLSKLACVCKLLNYHSVCLT